MKPVKIKVMFVILMTFALVLGFAPSRAQAYGNTAIWQIGISGNCNNPGFCGQELGGFWGWVEFDQGGTGDATLAGCGHMIASGPTHVAGAQYEAIDITSWSIDPLSNTFVINSGTITVRGNNAPPPFPITSPMYTGIPAQAGHYGTAQILGFSPPPGVNFQIQVAQIPNR